MQNANSKKLLNKLLNAEIAMYGEANDAATYFYTRELASGNFIIVYKDFYMDSFAVTVFDLHCGYDALPAYDFENLNDAVNFADNYNE